MLLEIEYHEGFYSKELSDFGSYVLVLTMVDVLAIFYVLQIFDKCIWKLSGFGPYR